jgi:sugar lactone lactonase YvrE
MLRTALILLFISLAAFSVSGGGPIFWRVDTRAEIEKGDARGISIADNGALTLAPSLTEVFDTKQAYVWCLAADAGGNIYLGTGHEGRVFKVDRDGRGTLLYKTGELDVMALAVDSKGNVYAGTAPDGKIYRITPGGQADVFFDAHTKYIWSLAFDREGRLLVGTGDKGVIFRVSPDGQGSQLVNLSQTNVTALKVDTAGNIIAGTDPGGLVLRISPQGRVFTLFDSSQREVRDLAIGKDGDIYALALSDSAGSGASNTSPASVTGPVVAPSAPSGDEGVVITIVDSASDSGTTTTTGGAPSSTSSSSKAALYRIATSGAIDTIWESKENTAFAVDLDGTGRALVGTGQKGRIYAVGYSQKPVLVAQSSEAQTSRFVRSGERIFAASSNLGKLFRLENEVSDHGTYTSSVRDAQTVATWGRISWLGEGRIEIQTRSGNTSMPDATWSDWSPLIGRSEGEKIASPSARFIQWRATLRRGGTPRLREVLVSYLPHNLPPVVSSITVLPVGVALQEMPQAQPDGNPDPSIIEPQALGVMTQLPPRRIFQRGAISLQWQASDRNGDSLDYSIYYRSADASSSDYYLLKSGLRESYFTIDANSLPDGRYVFKVVVSDAPSNPAGLALKGDAETEAINIDNTPPVVTADAPKASGDRFEVVFHAVDATSIVRRGEYQVDGGQWQLVFPADGLADSRNEDFRVSVTFSDRRPHVIAFRALDSNQNVGSAQVAIRGQ